MIEAEQLHARILARLDMTRDMEDEELTELIYEVLQEVSQEEYLPLDQKTMLGKELFNAFRKLDLLQEFLEDDDITEIMINGTQNIFMKGRGGYPSQIKILVGGQAGRCDPADRGRI